MRATMIACLFLLGGCQTSCEQYGRAWDDLWGRKPSPPTASTPRPSSDGHRIVVAEDTHDDYRVTLGSGSANVTMAVYNSIRAGTNLRRVVELAGEPSANLTRPADESGSRDTLILVWRNRDGSSMTLSFQKGRVMMKSQEGLDEPLRHRLDEFGHRVP